MEDTSPLSERTDHGSFTLFGEGLPKMTLLPSLTSFPLATQLDSLPTRFVC